MNDQIEKQPAGVIVKFTAMVEVDLKVDAGNEPEKAQEKIDYAKGYAAAVLERAANEFSGSVMNDFGYVPETSFEILKVNIGETPPEPTPEVVESEPEQDPENG